MKESIEQLSKRTGFTMSAEAIRVQREREQAAWVAGKLASIKAGFYATLEQRKAA